MAHSKDDSLDSRFFFRLGFSGSLKDPPVRPKVRSRASIRKATLAEAEQWLPIRAALLGKDRAELVASFMTRFDGSDAIDRLRNQPQLDTKAIGRVMTVILDTFDDPNVSVASRPVEVNLSAEERKKGARTLANAAEFLRSVGDLQLAEAVSSVAGRFEKRKGAGAPPSSFGDLALGLDAVLAAIPTPERNEIVSGLVSDFVCPHKPEQTRHLLKDRYRRMDRARAKRLREE
jgi:hypothetical protein